VFCVTVLGRTGRTTIFCTIFKANDGTIFKVIFVAQFSRKCTVFIADISVAVNSKYFSCELNKEDSLGLVFPLWVFPGALPRNFSVKCGEFVCCSFIFPLLYFPDLSHSVFLLIKYSSLLKSLLEVEICVLTKCLSELFQHGIRVGALRFNRQEIWHLICSECRGVLPGRRKGKS
jgi:hypothetical protein